MTSLVIFTIIGLYIFSTFAFSQATPVIDLEFDKKYNSWLDRAVSENLSPKKQYKLGIKLDDIICFENKIPVMKLTVNDSVACVKMDSAKKLEKRGWGIIKSESYDNIPAPIWGKHCWNVYFSSEPDRLQLVKDVRLALLHFSEKYAWQAVLIEGKMDDRFLISTPHLRSDEVPKLVDLLESGNYSKIEFREYSCSY